MENDDAVLVTLSTPLMIDIEMYSLWIQGLPEKEVWTSLQCYKDVNKYSMQPSFLLGEVRNNFLLFHHLEKYLHHPQEFISDLTLPIDYGKKLHIIALYYTFDENVMRENLGKKLSNSDRRDCEDISSKTGVPLRSCFRQFDNLRNVFKKVEEMPGSLSQNIRGCFLLPDSLAEQYAAVVFLTNNRIDTSKKKLQHLSFGDFAYCAQQMIKYWSYSSIDCEDHEDMDVDFDIIFLQDCRDIKTIVNKPEITEEHRTLVLQNCMGRLPMRLLSELEHNFKTLSKNVLLMASNVSTTREIRDLFLRIKERLVDPVRGLKWERKDYNIVLNSFHTTGHHLQCMKRNPHQRKTWSRFLQPLILCVIRTFHS